MRRRVLLRRSAIVAMSGIFSGCLDAVGESNQASPHSTPCPMADFDAVENDDYNNIRPFEQAIFERLNESRVTQDLEVVEWDDVLAYISRLHSRNMSRGDYTSHIDDSGRKPADRIREFGYGCENSNIENIFYLNGYKSSIDLEPVKLSKKAIEGWRESPPHREAMWSTTVEVAGVGCYINEDNDVYVTCKFCTHDPADAEDAGTGTPPEDCYYGGERP